MNGTVKVPPPRNEPVLSYAPGTPERAALKAKPESHHARIGTRRRMSQIGG